MIFSSPSYVLKGLFQLPFNETVKYTVTSNYGERKDPFNGEKSFHDGIDLAAPDGTEIVASYPGFVIETSYQEDGLGEYIVIEHNIEGEIYRTTYGHLLKDSTVVTVGERVDKNQKIATIGSTGRSTGTHVHFMISEFNNNKKNIIDSNFMTEEE
ncbi:MAG: M23 family metallopeptidase [Bacilli bacterium]|nr:M23 family metallopeptidase [Bacilli bacterium]